MSVRYVVERDTIDDELRRMESIGEELRSGFEATLVSIYALTQEDVHVVTGSLKASGRVESESYGDTWRGEISYGDEVVDYAEYERRRGARASRNGRTGHDFMERARAAAPLFEEVMYEVVSGRLR